MDEPLSFSSIHTAVLCGPNGHGKSSLLDAITWALWGQARGVDKRGTGTDDLIHHKEAHMQVEFTFELEGLRYRVIRSRSRKGKTGVSKLELQILDGDTARPLTGETMGITQESINKTLRMDYETFINSAFIMQGKADNFMAKSANERKEILSEILGLSFYDELEELAKEKRRGLNERLKVIDTKIASIEQELELLPAYKVELHSATEELALARTAIKEVEAELAVHREKKALFDVKNAQLADISTRTQRAETDIAALDEQLTALTASASRAKAIVEKEAAINAGYAKLVELRKKDEELTGIAQQHAALEASANEARLKIAKERSALEAEVRHLTQRKAELEKEVSKKPVVEAKLAQVDSALAGIEPLKKKIEELRTAYNGLRDKTVALGTQIEAGITKLEEAEQRRSLMTGDDACPLCKKPLDVAERRALENSTNKEIATLKSAIEKARTDKDSAVREMQAVVDEGKRLQDKVKGENELQADKGKLESELDACAGAAGGIADTNKRLVDIQLKLAQDAFAIDEHSSLRRVTADIEKLTYSPGLHQNIKKELKGLLENETLKANLENAKQTLESTGATIKTLAAQKESKLVAMREDEKRLQELASELAALDDITAAIARIETALAVKKRVESAATEKKTTAQVKIDGCIKLGQEKNELTVERKGIAREAGTYDRLTFIFSKKGIQALIIENTIPEIEEEANALLHRLTNGQMSLRFVTQKDKKTGGVVETLDLIITDGELGERKYELFSGGEAFRINFAVRIALSELLARRSGARLETLIIDEGFGTQDEEGKEKLIEAITAVQDDFKKIIVITHLDDLKEAFPARIEVTKKRGVGSVATVL
jgi:exonuclease SbcC